MQSSDELPAPASKRRHLIVAQTLLTAIQQGRFEPGSRLPAERELAEQFGTSRPTTREAILALELVGAITVRHGDGTYISEKYHPFCDAADLELGSSPAQVMEARMTVEPPVSGLLSGHVSGVELDEVQKDIDTAAGIVEDLTALPSFVDLLLRFHAHLARLCENRILNHMVSKLVDIDREPLWALLNQMALKTTRSRLTVLDEHQTIVDMVRTGDPEAAERAMRAHLHANKRQIFMEDLASKDTDVTDLAGAARLACAE